MTLRNTWRAVAIGRIAGGCWRQHWVRERRLLGFPGGGHGRDAGHLRIDITNRLRDDMVLAYAAPSPFRRAVRISDADSDIRFSTALDVPTIAHEITEEHVQTEPFHPLGNVMGLDGIVAT